MQRGQESSSPPRLSLSGGGGGWGGHPGCPKPAVPELSLKKQRAGSQAEGPAPWQRRGGQKQRSVSGEQSTTRPAEAELKPGRGGAIVRSSHSLPLQLFILCNLWASPGGGLQIPTVVDRRPGSLSPFLKGLIVLCPARA